MKKGFTLSETLIALAIVGIISVMVIPTTSRRVRNNIYASTLQSAVAQIMDALEEATAEQHVNDIAYLYENANNSTTREELFLSEKLNSIADCGSTPEPCFASAYSTLNNTALDDFTSGYNAYVTIKNGASVALRFPVDSANPDEVVQGEILIDANGSKTPNIYGRDTFKLSLHADSAIGAFGDLADDETMESALAKCRAGSDYNFMCYYYISQNDWKNDY